MFNHALYSFRTFAHLLTKVQVTVTNRWKMGVEDEMAEAIYPWLKSCIDYRHDLVSQPFHTQTLSLSNILAKHC